MTPQILSVGGSDFSAAAGHPSLDSYILAQAEKPEPRVGFIATAGGDSPAAIADFYAAYTQLTCKPSHLPFFGRTPDLRSYIFSQDVIYVGGGNTKSLLGVWKEWGLVELLREAWQAGIVLSGVSAGAICWFEGCITDSYAGELRSLEGLGWLKGSCCPHYDSEPERRPTYRRLVAAGEARPGLALDDWALAHFQGLELQRVVAAKPGAGAYRVTRTPTSFDETALPAEHLSIP